MAAPQYRAYDPRKADFGNIDHVYNDLSGNFDTFEQFDGMGAWYDDLWEGVKDEATKTFDKIVQDAPAEIMKSVGTAISANPNVQQVAAKAAEKKILEESVQQLTNTINSLKNEATQAINDPVGYVQKKPMNVAIVAGVGAVVLGGLFIFSRGLKK